MRSGLDRSVLVARVELVRKWRALQEDTKKLAATALAGVFMGLFFLGFLAAAFVGGRLLVAGELGDASGLAGSVVAVAWLALLFVVGMRAYQQSTDVDRVELLLTTVDYRLVFFGLLLAEAAVVFGVSGVPVFLVALAFGLGSGSVAGALAVLVVYVCLVASALVVAHALAFAVKLLVKRSKFVAKHKLALGLLFWIAYLALFLPGDNVAFRALVRFAGWVPVVWLADLLLLGVTPMGSALVAAAGLGCVLLGVPAFLAVDSWLAGWVWYADSREKELESGSWFGGYGLGLDWLPLGGPVRAVVRKSWLRARRSPIKLIYVVYPVFLAYQPLVESYRLGRVTVFVVVFVGFYGAWATGALFTLNSLGDEGAVLPVTLSTPVRGREFVLGRVVAGAAVGAPVTAFLVFVLGLLSPFGALESLFIAVSAAVLCVGAAALASGIGVAFPKFEGSRIAGSTKAVTPGLIAFGLYSVSLIGVGLAGILVYALFLVGSGVPSVVVGWVAAAIASVALGLYSYGYAVRKFDGYHLD